MVSIHAPQEWCDSQAAISSKRSQCFNSRTPGGVRLITQIYQLYVTMFQFTHPGRGATCCRSHQVCHGRFNSRIPGGVRRVYQHLISLSDGVSIHAPREGCDHQAQDTTKTRATFQFTHPGRGATAPCEIIGCISAVSIHAPREGCDGCRVGHAHGHAVSIHAPREGCDACGDWLKRGCAR